MIGLKIDGFFLCEPSARSQASSSESIFYLQPTNLISAIPILFPLCALCVLCGQSPKQPRFPLTTVFANALLPTSFSVMKYAFLGAGRMASAIIQGMLRANVCEPSDIVAACPEPDLLQSLRDATSIKIVSENAEAAAESPVLILCVKPQDAAKALKQTGAHLKNKLLISIAAGLSLETLQNLAPGARVLRAMPNTAALALVAAAASYCESAARIVGALPSGLAGGKPSGSASAADAAPAGSGRSVSAARSVPPLRRA